MSVPLPVPVPPPATAPASAPVPVAVVEAPPAEEEPVEELLCRERLNVVMVAAECAPWSKTGGLGDVAGALPKALARRGHRVMCVAPRYAAYPEAFETGARIELPVQGYNTTIGYFHAYIDGVDYVFVDHPSYHHYHDNIYGGDRQELSYRLSMLCHAALEAVWTVPCGGAPYGDENLVFIANDWHTALLPVYLQAFYRDYGKMEFARCIMVVHNMAHQGRGPMKDFSWYGLPDHYRDHFFLDDPFGGECSNQFKAGLICAHRIVAVSHGYAWEITTDMGGWGLAPLLREQEGKLRGIVNGIDLDEWSPEKDEYLEGDGYENFTPDAKGLEGKLACKRALQKEMGWEPKDDVLLIGFIGRLDFQKGVDIILESSGFLLNHNVRLIMLGTGSPELEDGLRHLEECNKDKVRGWVGFSVKMAHRITAACDLLLMPSRFEPCGLNQLYAMRYGTVPVVHAVGGLRDTVKPFDPYENSGTGWTFEPAGSDQLNEALGNAIHTYEQFPESFRGIQLRGMTQDLSWDHAADLYEEALIDAKYSW